MDLQAAVRLHIGDGITEAIMNQVLAAISEDPDVMEFGIDRDNPAAQRRTDLGKEGGLRGF